MLPTTDQVVGLIDSACAGDAARMQVEYFILDVPIDHNHPER